MAEIRSLKSYDTSLRVQLSTARPRHPSLENTTSITSLIGYSRHELGWSARPNLAQFFFSLQCQVSCASQWNFESHICLSFPASNFFSRLLCLATMGSSFCHSGDRKLILNGVPRLIRALGRIINKKFSPRELLKGKRSTMSGLPSCFFLSPLKAVYVVLSSPIRRLPHPSVALN